MRFSKFTKWMSVLVAAVTLAALGAVSGWNAASRSHKAPAATSYPLLDPSASDPAIHQEIINFDPLRQTLKKYFGSLNLAHSLYFEYLPNGVNVRDGDDNASQAASLMKTPLVMDLYKLAEQGKINLDGQNTVQPVDIDNDPQYGNPTHLKAGDNLSLRQAAQITLRYSDNTTLNVIKSRIIPLIDDTSDSFRSLDLSYSLGSPALQEQLSISARSYSSILKCLYYACFNSLGDSTEIIGYLIGSSESNRLAAGVAANVKVAHKVGSGGADAQSDCGIVYVPGKPYLLCLMFFNIHNDANTDPYFQHVSKTIYDYIVASGR